MKNNSSSLLPNGLEDLLPPFAGHEADLSYRLINDFVGFGYRRVKTPLAEFEDSLLAGGPSSKLSHKTFRVMDPVSKKMMGVRSDTTPQIGRLALSRLRDAARPLRLSYCADILRVQGSDLRPERQYCQVGCELIGDESLEADVEILLIAVHSLMDLGLEGLSVDLCCSSLINTIFDEYDVKSSEREEYLLCLAHRDRDSLSAFDCEAARVFCLLIDAIGRADKGFTLLSDHKFPSRVRAVVDELESRYEAFVQGLTQMGIEGVSVTLDLVEKRGFEYHKGMGFALFAKGVRGELGRGGRYDAGLGDEAESAVGFTFYMDSVRRAVGEREMQYRFIYVPYGVSWADVLKVQDDGYCVIRGDYQVDQIEEIRGLGCAYCLRDGQVFEI